MALIYIVLADLKQNGFIFFFQKVAAPKTHFMFDTK